MSRHFTLRHGLIGGVAVNLTFSKIKILQKDLYFFRTPIKIRGQGVLSHHFKFYRGYQVCHKDA